MRPLVAIVGRPNVGKSTFFNRIAGKRISIVENTPGVTRDRIYANVEWTGHAFTMIDTGGLDLASEDVLLSGMRQQAQIATETAQVILFFVDGKAGLTTDDQDVAEYLRRCGKPVILIVGKIDNPKDEELIYDFYNLGMGHPFGVSSVHGLGIGEVLDEIVSYFSDKDQDIREDGIIHIAIVGKPNAGKSSLVNAMLKEERVLVSDIPGTTRDAIDTPFTYEGKNYMLVDTAGMRRKSKIEDESVERYSVLRALAAVRRADVVLVMIDADQGISEQDAKIAGYVEEEGKPVVILVNKWDLIEKDNHTMKEYTEKVYSTLSFLTWAPIIFISCKTGQRLDRIIPEVLSVYDHAHLRIKTGILNEMIGDAVAAVEPPSMSGRQLNIMYATQTDICPPTFQIFVNHANLIHVSYERYLYNYMRKTFDLTGTPIRFIFKGRDEGGNKE